MVQTKPQLVSFDQFIEWYPEYSEFRYELHDGVIVEMPKPTGKHSKVAGFTVSRFTGRPKLPTVWVYQLNSDGEYEGKDFHGSDRIESHVFPDLHLTAAQLLNAKD
jgi:Uma2 family endonuclease